MTTGETMIVSALVSFFVTSMCLIVHIVLRHLVERHP